MARSRQVHNKSWRLPAAGRRLLWVSAVLLVSPAGGQAAEERNSDISATAGAPARAVAAPAANLDQRNVTLNDLSRRWQEVAKAIAAREYPKAIALIDAIRPVEIETFGANSPQAINNWRTLAKMQEANQDYTAARAAGEQVRTISAALYGDGAWQTADSRRDLADLEMRSHWTAEQRGQWGQIVLLGQKLAKMHGQKQDAEAIALAEATLKSCEQLLGTEHPLYADTLFAVAEEYARLKDWTKARALHARAMALRLRVLGDHPATAAAMATVAACDQLSGNAEEALRMDERALALRQKVLPPADPVLLSQLRAMGTVYINLGQTARARELVRQSLELRSKSAGENSVSYAQGLYDLAGLSIALGDYKSAEKQYRQALEVYRAAGSAWMPNTRAGSLIMHPHVPSSDKIIARFNYCWNR